MAAHTGFVVCFTSVHHRACLGFQDAQAFVLRAALHCRLRVQVEMEKAPVGLRHMIPTARRIIAPRIYDWRGIFPLKGFGPINTVV